MKLADGESIVTAYAQAAAGPGWSNTPVWVIVRGADGKLREECLQPTEQTQTMRLFYRISQEAHLTMKEEAESLVRRRRKS